MEMNAMILDPITADMVEKSRRPKTRGR